MGSCGIRELRDCVAAESRSYRVMVLESCRVAEPQGYIHSLELQSCIITELLSPRVIMIMNDNDNETFISGDTIE